MTSGYWVISGHFEADLVRAFERIAAEDFSTNTADLLIDYWLPLANRA